MKLSDILAKFVPQLSQEDNQILEERKELNSIRQLNCDADRLISKNDFSLKDTLSSSSAELSWGDAMKNIEPFEIPDGTGGVNPGDRRAIHYLICKFKPSSVLEVGTHIGASTLHIASALYMNQIRNGESADLTTVDITDVNSSITKPWVGYGMKFSPLEMIDRFKYGSFVKFITDTSLNYFEKCSQKYDFIFLDGDHSAKTVYQEIPMALKLLNQNGVILLHDYFPKMKPLWSDGSMIPGPYLAVERLIKEGANLSVIPLGLLPWPTKQNSNATSLALLLRSN